MIIIAFAKFFVSTMVTARRKIAPCLGDVCSPHSFFFPIYGVPVLFLYGIFIALSVA